MGIVVAGYCRRMVTTVLFLAAAIVVVLTVLDYIPLLLALPAIGIVVAVLLGYMMRRGSGPHPPPQ